jgi:hypothetical protein
MYQWRNGTFYLISPYIVVEGSNGTSIQSIIDCSGPSTRDGFLKDVDGDGTDELIQTTYDNKKFTYKFNGTEYKPWKEEPGSPYDPRDWEPTNVYLKDLDTDGIEEYIEATAGEAFIFKFNGRRYKFWKRESTSLYNFGESPGGIIKDLDSDGIEEIIEVTPDNEKLIFKKFNGTKFEFLREEPRSSYNFEKWKPKNE